MSGTEIAVVVAGLFAGYWLVGFLLDRGQPRREPPPSAEWSAQPNAGLPAPAGGQPLWHEVLQVSPAADVALIRAAYRQRIDEYHPERVAPLAQDLRELARQRSLQIEAAYRTALRLHGVDE